MEASNLVEASFKIISAAVVNAPIMLKSALLLQDGISCQKYNRLMVYVGYYEPIVCIMKQPI
jgi:hypothetical protein